MQISLKHNHLYNTHSLLIVQIYTIIQHQTTCELNYTVRKGTSLVSNDNWVSKSFLLK